MVDVSVGDHHPRPHGRAAVERHAGDRAVLDVDLRDRGAEEQLAAVALHGVHERVDQVLERALDVERPVHQHTQELGVGEERQPVGHRPHVRPQRGAQRLQLGVLDELVEDLQQLGLPEAEQRRELLRRGLQLRGGQRHRQLRGLEEHLPAQAEEGADALLLLREQADVGLEELLQPGGREDLHAAGK